MADGSAAGTQRLVVALVRGVHGLRGAVRVEVLTDRVRLANLRYEGGVDLYLSVLDAERQLFNAQLELARVRLDEVSTVVQLYKALGGGWAT